MGYPWVMSRTCCPGHASGALDDLMPCPLVIEEAYYNPQMGAPPARVILCVENSGRVWVSEADGTVTDLDVTADEARQLLASPWRPGGRGE